jgi:hypothetical protein
MPTKRTQLNPHAEAMAERTDLPSRRRSILRPSSIRRQEVSEVGHLRIAVETLAERVRRHEEQLRRLELPPRRKSSSR